MKEYTAKINIIRNLCFILFIAFSFYFFPFAVSASTIGKPLNFLTLNTGLVGHWTFDGPKMLTNVADSSGNSNHGYLSGQTSTTTVGGKFGQALLFDGSNDYVSTGNFNVGSSNFTISVWLKKPSGTGDFYFLNQQDGSGNHWYLEIYNNKIYWHTTASGWVSGTNSVNINAWNHIVIVGNDANTLFYLNGALDKTGAKSSDISSANIPLFIGYNSNYGAYFNGSLDEVRIYNRALSTTEIQQLYNLSSITKFGITPRGIPNTGLRSGLVGHWTFDGPMMITNVADSSGQGNNGYLSGQISTTTVAGKLGQALSFDGTDDYVSVPDNSVFEPNNFTVTAWIRTNSLASQEIVTKDSSSCGGYRNFWWFGLSAGSYLRPRVAVGNDSSAQFQYVTDSSGNNIADGNWHFVAGSYESGGSLKTYKDGILIDEDTGSISGPVGVNNYSLNIGGCSSGVRNLNGLIDDVRIYNRALSATEIRQLYNQGR